MAKNKMDTKKTSLPGDFMALRRRRNYAVLGGIVFLCVLFYLITILRLGAS
jgi:hypothetical protein